MRILVIDDQDWRRPFYKKLDDISSFHFEVGFLEEDEVKDLSMKLKNFDLILLDVVLNTNWQYNSLQLARRIRDIEKTIPIVLVTGNWSATNNEEISEISQNYDAEAAPLFFTDFLDKDEFNNLLQDQVDKRESKGISNTNIEYVSRTIANIYSKTYNQIYLNKRHDESLFVLHLSDMQLGGDTVSGNLLEPSSIAQHFLNHYETPDFIVVTGDIAEHGEAKEFDAAYSWLNDLCTEFGWSLPSNRLMFIPGNHDVYAPTFGMCRFKYGKLEDQKKSQLNVVDDIVEIENVSQISLFNYTQFSLKANASKHYEECLPYWIEDRFYGSGVVFVGLNSLAENKYESPFLGYPSEFSYQKLRCELRDAGYSSDTLIIAATHHPDLTKTNEFVTFSEASPSPHIVLSGHNHKADFFELRELNQLQFIAPTSSLKAALRYEGAPRGFSVIELKRKNNKVSSIKQFNHNRIGTRWEVTGNPTEFEFRPNTKNKVWREVYEE